MVIAPGSKAAGGNTFNSGYNGSLLGSSSKEACGAPLSERTTFCRRALRTCTDDVMQLRKVDSQKRTSAGDTCASG